MADYSQITQHDWNLILEEIVDEQPTSHLLSIPGIYEVLSEYYNNDIIEAWVSRCEQDEEN